MSSLPQAAVALNGGDMWTGMRQSAEELEDALDEAMSMQIHMPIIPQFYPDRLWLWQRWHGTIVRQVLPREVLLNMLFAGAVVLCVNHLSPLVPIAKSTKVGAMWWSRTVTVTHPNQQLARFAVALASIDKVWLLLSGLVSFTLSFFLSQSYSLWRNVYSVTRRVQGRLNDLGLLCATSVERHPDGSYTEDAEKMLETMARYVRLFNYLMYASVTTRFAPLLTPRGLKHLCSRGALTRSEREILLRCSMGHNAVLGWLTTLFNSALSDGRLGDSRTSAIPLQVAIQSKTVELRSAYASIKDELSGRMPLAYTQLVQIMVDVLIFLTPFALMHSVGGIGAIVGTGLVTLFHSSILSLAKMFLDPFNNDDSGGDGAGIAINVATLMQETNLGSQRWRNSAVELPDGTRPIRRRLRGKHPAEVGARQVEEELSGVVRETQSVQTKTGFDVTTALPTGSVMIDELAP